MATETQPHLNGFTRLREPEAKAPQGQSGRIEVYRTSPEAGEGPCATYSIVPIEGVTTVEIRRPNDGALLGTLKMRDNTTTVTIQPNHTMTEPLTLVLTGAPTGTEQMLSMGAGANVVYQMARAIAENPGWSAEQFKQCFHTFELPTANVGLHFLGGNTEHYIA